MSDIYYIVVFDRRKGGWIKQDQYTGDYADAMRRLEKYAEGLTFVGITRERPVLPVDYRSQKSLLAIYVAGELFTRPC